MKIFQKGSVFIVSLIFIFLTALFAAGILLITSIEHRNVIRDQLSLTALHLAEAGAEDAIWALKNLYTPTEWSTAGWNTGGNPYTKTVSTFTDSAGTKIGAYYVTVKDPTSTTPTIESTGYSPVMTGDIRKRTIKITVTASPGNGNIKAAIVANSDTNTLGGLTVDGRNHDLNGIYIGNGTLGVYTTGTYTQGSGATTTGGTTSDLTDYVPNNPYPSGTVTASATWSDYPTTPDAVLSYSEGTLKAKAQSGTGGSQYVTDPSSLTPPLKGVTYVEYSSTWNAGSFDFSGTGILVVHSSTGNTACIKTLNTGTFKGLIIADNVDKIHNNIYGAVLTMATSPSGNCIGNGNGQILYSAEAVSKAFWAAGSITLTWQER